VYMNFRLSKHLGYQQITDLSAAVGLTVPAGTIFALVTPETQGVRWRMDGTDPTASVGYPLAAGNELELDVADIASIKFIQQSASAKLNVVYFGKGPTA
jgi:hypothetical protein